MEKLLNESNEIQSYIETVISNNPEELLTRLGDLMVFLARSAEMLAEAKRILRIKKSTLIQDTIITIAQQNCLSAKVQNALVDSIAEEESYLVDKIERQNAAITHQIDALRSMLSYEKTQLSLIRTGY